MTIIKHSRGASRYSQRDMRSQYPAEQQGLRIGRNSIREMVGAGYFAARQTLQHGVQFVLHGQQRYCLLCEMPQSGQTGGLPLCTTCFQQIPWIRQIECLTCGRYETCNDCWRRKDTGFIFSRSAVKYDANMKQWLARWKYRGDERLLEIFHGMLRSAYHNLEQELTIIGRQVGVNVGNMNESLHNKGRATGERSAGRNLNQRLIDAMVYVPLSRQRLEERGFNQAERLASLLAQDRRIPLLGLLQRTRHTDKQSFKSRAERLHDLENAFAVHPAALTQLNALACGRPVRILLIDDVYTTGSTLSQCAKVITAALPAEVYGLTWAR